ncbi:TmcC family electron transfer complex membrane anchor subunit [Desulfonatronovibrio hydrogenovorans]|uniref:TmcC family electron transfer complex membrane anchor subunit n=1 Tax=Desulfonatronovibrio hydrogenovorans TaxID=53245 RepID=UPI00048D1411|nr:respiratory nitrate reductase subunit gamma [Desulfonatronovibrio hydrogenovorans]
MHQLYEFVSGPLAWIAWTVFIVGSLTRVVVLVTSTIEKDPVVVNYFSLKHALRSMVIWSIPFFPRSSRLNPVMTVVSFTFHICVILVPLFALGHIVLWEEFFGISFWALPDRITDIMTLMVIFGLIFFIIRRFSLKEVKYVSSWSDYMLPLLILAPFVTGYAAFHGWFNPQLMLILHIFSGEVLLMAIPFTRLVHMVFAPFTRAYTASEFGAVRHAKDW